VVGKNSHAISQNQKQLRSPVMIRLLKNIWNSLRPDTRKEAAQETNMEERNDLCETPKVEPLGDKPSSGQQNVAQTNENPGDLQEIEALIGALTHQFEHERRAAAEALANDARAVEPLIKALEKRGNSSHIRCGAAWALGRLGDLRAVEPLIKALAADDYEDVSWNAANSLGILADGRAVEPLFKGLRDGRRSVRQAAANALANFGQPDWKQWVLGQKDDFYRLGQSGHPRALEFLINSLKDLTGDDLKWGALALGKCGDRRAVEPLINKLGAYYPAERLAVVEALGKLGDLRALEPLQGALGDVDSAVRRTSAEALAKLGQPEWSGWVTGQNDDFTGLGESGDARAVNPLLKALRDKYGRIKPTAVDVAAALGKLRDPRAVESLIAALKVDNPEMRLSVAEALGKLEDSRAVEPLIQALGDSDALVRCAVAEALRKLGQPDWGHWVRGQGDDFEKLGESGHPRAAEPLLKVLENSDGSVWGVAARALGKLGDGRAIESLTKALGNRDAAVRLAAVEALDNLSNVKAVEPLIKTLSDGESSVRRAAAQTLCNLARSHPSWIGSRWSEINSLITKPHTDTEQDNGRSSDCTSTHTDTGIGLGFPPKPSETEF
jgi:HEAT repeat protein